MQVPDHVQSPLGYFASNASRFSCKDLHILSNVLMCVLCSSFVLPWSVSSSRPRSCSYPHCGCHPRHFLAHYLGLQSAEGDEASVPRSREARGVLPKQHIVMIPIVVLEQ